MIVAISGTPGTGKSEVAKAIAEKLKWGLVDLNKLAEEKKLYLGYDSKRDCKIVDLKGLAKEIEKLTGDCIIESHYAHDMPADLVIVLRANPAEIRKRLKGRGWTTEKIEENVEAEIMEICVSEALEKGRKVFQVDTTGKTVKSTASEAMRIIKTILKPSKPRKD
jgi:adenylate kinase